MNPKEAYETAQAHARQGEYVKAARALQGQDHPKCIELLNKVQATSEFQAWQRRRRLISMAGVALVFLVVGIGIGTLLGSSSDSSATEAPQTINLDLDTCDYEMWYATARPHVDTFLEAYRASNNAEMINQARLYRSITAEDCKFAQLIYDNHVQGMEALIGGDHPKGNYMVGYADGFRQGHVETRMEVDLFLVELGKLLAEQE